MADLKITQLTALTTPTTDDLLAIVNDPSGSALTQKITYANLFSNVGTINGGTAANEDLTLQGTSSATRDTSYVILQPTAGNVGIGTTGPGAQLQVNLPTVTTATVNSLLISRWTRPQTPSVKWGNSMDILLGSYSTSINSNSRVDFKLADGATDLPDTTVMTLQGNGYVGIGTTAPGRRLEIYNNDATYTTDGLNDSAHILTLYNPATRYPTFPGPTVGLAFIPSANAYGTESDLGFRITSQYTVDAYTGFKMYFQRSTSPGVWANMMTLDAYTNNVGIGTTAPAQTLELKNGSSATNMLITDGSNSAKSVYIGTQPFSSTEAGIYTGGSQSFVIGTNSTRGIVVDTNQYVIVSTGRIYTRAANKGGVHNFLLTCVSTNAWTTMPVQPWNGGGGATVICISNGDRSGIYMCTMGGSSSQLTMAYGDGMYYAGGSEAGQFSWGLRWNGYSLEYSAGSWFYAAGFSVTYTGAAGGT